MCLAVPGRIHEILDEDPLVRWGWVEFGAVRQRVALACVPEARIDDYVLVHAGIAISVMDVKEAEALLETLAALEGDTPDALPG